MDLIIIEPKCAIFAYFKHDNVDITVITAGWQHIINGYCLLLSNYDKLIQKYV